MRHLQPVGDAKEIAAATDMYLEGLSYRQTARNMGDHRNLTTGAATVHHWVQDRSRKVNDIANELFKSRADVATLAEEQG